MSSCPFCEQVGLPIMPVRYALARTDGVASAPDLSTPFSQSIPLPDANAQYTLRLLRQGYLYVYDESMAADDKSGGDENAHDEDSDDQDMGAWSAYAVTPEGYLFEFDIEDKTPPDVSKKAPCKRGTDPYQARCITVPDIQSATKLWLGFSDTAWTQDVLKKHQDEAYRKAHMTCIDVHDWVTGGGDQTNMTAMGDLPERVAEFSPGCQGGDDARESLQHLTAEDSGAQDDMAYAIKQRMIVKKQSQIPFYFAMGEFQPLGETTDPLTEWATQQGQQTVAQAQNAGMTKITCGTPAIVGVEDPIGISVDINGLIVQLLEEWQWIEDKERLWKQVTSKSILSLKEAVGEQEVKHRRARYMDAYLSQYGYSGHRLYKHEAEKLATQRAQSRTKWWPDPQEQQRAFQQIKASLLTAWRPPGGYVTKQEALQSARDYADARIAQDGGVEHIKEQKWINYADLNNWMPGDDPTYDEQQRTKDQTAINDALTQYDKNHVTPLSTAWLAWVQSDLFIAQFTHNHDDNDLDSGMSYVTLLTLVAHNATGRADVVAFLAQELAKDPNNLKHVWSRAMAMNQTVLVDKLEAGQVDLNDPHSFTLEGALFMGGLAALLDPDQHDKIGQQTDKISQWVAANQARIKPVQNRIARYIREMTGPLLEALGDLPSQLVLGVTHKRLMSVLAGISYDPSITRYVMGQKAMLTESQAQVLLEQAMGRVGRMPNSPFPAPARNMVDDAHVLAQGENPSVSEVTSVALLTEQDIQSGDWADYKAPDDAQGSGSDWTRVDSDAYGDVDAGTYMKVQEASIYRSALSASSFAAGVVGLLITAWGLKTAYGKLNGDTSKQVHFGVASTAMVAGIFELTGAAMENTKWGSTKLSKPINTRLLQAETKAARLAGVARIVGAFAGIVLGAWSFVSGILKLDKNRSLAYFQIGTGLLTVALGICMLFASFGGLGFILFIAVALISFIWHFFVNDKYQNWLTRSYYGTGSNKFEDMLAQQTAFQRITAPPNASDESDDEQAAQYRPRDLALYTPVNPWASLASMSM